MVHVGSTAECNYSWTRAGYATLDDDGAHAEGMIHHGGGWGADLPELEVGDLVVAALILYLPEHLVQVQVLLVGKGGHLVPALGTPVPVNQKAGEAVLVQPTHQI